MPAKRPKYTRIGQRTHFNVWEAMAESGLKSLWIGIRPTKCNLHHWYWYWYTPGMGKTNPDFKLGCFETPSVNSYLLARWSLGRIILTRRSLGGLPSYHHISMKKLWKNCYTTIQLWSPTKSGGKISAVSTGFRIFKKYLDIFGGLGSNRPVCHKKAPKIEAFRLRPLWNLNFGTSKIIIFF